jgi:hypothetical protein
MDNTVSKLPYKPLDAHQDEIRLLILNPSEEADPVSCRIAHKALAPGLTQSKNNDDGISGYEALSYEWGKPLDNRLGQPLDKPEQFELHSIIVDGQAIGIRWNLHCALRQLRLSDEPRVLWVDALCINQEDGRERNHQVTLMKMIYARADRTIMWLGVNQWSRLNPLLRMKDFNNFSLRAIETGEAGYRLSDMELKYLSVWYGLLGASYWTRLWIIQEVVLSRDVVLQLGDATATWEDFHRFCTGIDGLLAGNRRNAEWLVESSTRVPFLLCRQRIAKMQSPQEVPLFDLVLTFGKSLCMDIRDRIFGLHSLCPQCCSDSTPVEYAVPLYQKCEELTYHYLLEHYGAGEKGPSDIDCSVLPRICQSIQAALGVHCRDYLRSISLAKRLTPVKVTGDIIGIVSLVASSQHVDALTPLEYRYSHYSRSVIKPIFQGRVLHALTPEIFQQLQQIKTAKKWFYNIPWLSLPPLAVHELPKLLKMPEKTQLPRIIPHNEGQAKSWKNTWQYEVSELKAEKKREEKRNTGWTTDADTGIRRYSSLKLQRRRGYDYDSYLDSTYKFSFFASEPLSFYEFIAGIISHSPRNCNAFFCTNGIIGHSYGDVREGDIICGFKGSRAILALRCIFGAYYVAALGWNTFHDLELASSSPSIVSDSNVRSRTIDVLFRMPDLMALSADWK